MEGKEIIKGKIFDSLNIKFPGEVELTKLKESLDEAVAKKIDLTNLFNKQGYSILHFLSHSHSGNFEVAEFIVSYALNNDISSFDNSNNNDNESKLRQRRRDLKTWLNRRTPDNNMFTCLIYAAYNGKIGICSLWIKHGADINITNLQKVSVMHIAAQGDLPVSLVYFLETKGVDIDIIDRQSRTPLHYAANFGSETAACYLVAYGAYIDAKDCDGNTPLHLSISNYERYASLDCIKKLLLNGADRFVMNRNGETPLDVLMGIKGNVD